MRVVRYSYQVDGRTYAGETTSREGFRKGFPVQVTVAVSDPSVSTIQPDEVQSGYVTSFVLCILALLPLFVMGCLEVAHRFKRKDRP